MNRFNIEQQFVHVATINSRTCVITKRVLSVKSRYSYCKSALTKRIFGDERWTWWARRSDADLVLCRYAKLVLGPLHKVRDRELEFRHRALADLQPPVGRCHATLHVVPGHRRAAIFLRRLPGNHASSLGDVRYSGCFWRSWFVCDQTDNNKKWLYVWHISQQVDVKLKIADVCEKVTKSKY